MDFATHITFEEVVVGSQGTFIASRTTFIRWHGAKLVPVETLIGSCRACLALRETVIGSEGTSVVSTETCFQEVARGALATLTSCAYAHVGDLCYPQREVIQTSLG